MPVGYLRKKLVQRVFAVGQTLPANLTVASHLLLAITVDPIRIFVYLFPADNSLRPRSNLLQVPWDPITVGQYIIASVDIQWKKARFQQDGAVIRRSPSGNCTNTSSGRTITNNAPFSRGAIGFCGCSSISAIVRRCITNIHHIVQYSTAIYISITHATSRGPSKHHYLPNEHRVHRTAPPSTTDRYPVLWCAFSISIMNAYRCTYTDKNILYVVFKSWYWFKKNSFINFESYSNLLMISSSIIENSNLKGGI